MLLDLQIVFIGSDGKEYAFLAKPEDDLRKDSRMMEVAGVLNRLFAKEPASRRRNLYIRRCASHVNAAYHIVHASHLALECKARGREGAR